MSDGMIIFLAILGFLLVSEAINALSGRNHGGRKAAAATQAVVDQLQLLDVTLQDIRTRVTSIEGILQQVE